MAVSILKRKRTKKPGAGRLRRKAELILSSLGLDGAELSVLLTDDAEIRSLNRDYRGKDRPTDVLSFSQREGEFPGVAPEQLGDVVISLDTAARQAEKLGHSLDDEVERLLVHGVLHLAGYDHEKGGAEARRMRDREKKTLELLAGEE
ncbi:MAG: rRNA maturation RNase YbeY [Candidatus Nitrospinota bacterium M3_3B_026]